MTLASFDTRWPADTVAFAPDHEDLLLLGTYLLREATDETPMNRVGEVILLQRDQQQLNVLQRFELGSVLDIKWRNLLAAAATGDGTVAQFSFSGDQGLSRLDDVQTAPVGVLCLALDWSSAGQLAVTHSDGSLALVDLTSNQVEKWHACDFEPWAVACATTNSHTLFSGGDDCMWKMWDTRTDPHVPVFSSRRTDAGVTALAPNPHDPDLLAVGSYDGTVITYDLRAPRRALQEANVGGGAWRVRWHPSTSRPRDALVACMHDGFKLVRFGDEVQILKRFDEHTSLAYGVDWARVGNAEETVVASCSFYDHALKIWTA